MSGGVQPPKDPGPSADEVIKRIEEALGSRFEPPPEAPVEHETPVPPPPDPPAGERRGNDGGGGSNPSAKKLVANERLKLLTNAIDRAATACFTVGVATPLAGALYQVSGINALPWWWLAGGFTGWLLAAVSLHLIARHLLRGLIP